MRKAACLFGLTAVHGQDLFLGKTDEAVDADVIIIGAGWAGMAAADHLHRNDVNFIVLEAANRTGGRTHAFEFGSDAVGKFIFEQGSNWLQGTGHERFDKFAPSITKNPVVELAKRADPPFATVLIPGSTDGNMTNYYKVYDEFGVDTDVSGDLRRHANEVIDCINQTAPKANNKETLRQGLKACGWNPSTNAEWAMDWALADDDSGVTAHGSALAGFLPDPSYDWWGPDDWFVVEQHPRGFARLIDVMVQDSVPPADARVVLNTKVSNIEWSAHGVTISTTDGRTFKAKHAISTMSLGVIQKHHEELFEPNLPKKQQKSLATNHILMANLTHVLIQFPSVWWDNSIPAWISANEGGKSNRGLFTAWHNMNMDGFIPGSNTLLTFLGEPEASIYGAMTEAELLPILVERLRAQNPSLTIPEATAAWTKNWGNDPLHYGAYAYSEPGVSWKTTWKKPLKDNKKTIVQFAGEATCDNLDGYTHGALQSGKEAAAIYLHEYKNGPNPEKDDEFNLCNWYYYA